ncbi:tRNA (adenosine(37)-N6)-dimethylallyltransferase MiaA [Prosthecochloris sp. SCSIO W1101]|uniref:tRNA (adenosine(37)-N6)-dimethylallyltransferase MiaA n=1 Tax=Prosthecochloris sp. SCSIO W1101 TaxID=2992242 RepID=UPI00223CADB1|nr:tRNA (adenosine(37)-N6)-dimethylallyltransferase MiaA [Prosthecochloris sp. SCSIO W1101]UZJ40271.1 tRNA (adenosine(37)-N6)-dimethylallyltransferase MiaA [Prosthecochloris sp. SCSIO W1101]
MTCCNTSSENKPVLVISGPTASGKSALAHAAAKILEAEILSADSRQIYRGMDIGTAKPSATMLEEIPYHFINEKEIDEEYNAGDFTSAATRRIRSILEKGNNAIVVGGSTLYIEGLLCGFTDLPAKNPQIRRELEEELKTSGKNVLYQRLKSIDPEQAATLDPSKTQRLVRSLEIIAVTGKTVTELQTAVKKRFHSITFVPIALSLPRKELYERIDKRTDEMMASGLLGEAEKLYILYRKDKTGHTINALETVGYKELFQYFEGKHSLETAVELIKQHTRNYAKRQLTFFRNRLNVKWIAAPRDKESLNKLVHELTHHFFCH